MTTKERILKRALDQFNEHGYTQVSVRMIADQLHMSPGNFTYHYKKKDEIVEALFDSLLARLENELDSLNVSGNIVSSILESIHNLYQHMYEYRFLFLEQMYFGIHYPEMKDDLSKFRMKRRGQFMHIFEQLRDLNLMFVETIKGYDSMILEQIDMQSNFWLSQELINGTEIGPMTIRKGVKGFYAIILPHLTLAGKSFFGKEFKKSEKISVLRF